ncbi:MAG TPA: GAF domain-containing sensor histidine kinase [Longimicrobiales bacterium]|nr:GAF domain-containing sensor histidine kinase [Longimicrobiales bacterium]
MLAEAAGYEDTLAAVAGLALPDPGSWCILDVVEHDGSLRRVDVVHPDPKAQDRVRRLGAGWPPERDGPRGVPRAVRTRRAELVREVTDDLLVSVARSAENLSDLRALSIGSILTVPLVARDEVLGAVTYVSEGGRGYDEGDVRLAEDLAWRCAMALRHARLYDLAEEARATSAVMNERLILASLRDHDLAAAAETASEAKSRFIAAMSHEFRTPLNAIGMYSALMRTGREGPVTEGQQAYLRHIEAAMWHLDRLLTDILDLAKVEAGHLDVRCRPGSMTEVITEVIAMVAPEAAASDVELRAPAESGATVWYEGDPDRVRQILLNLVSNAVHFTPHGGSVFVTFGLSLGEEPHLEGRGPWAYVTVRDTGVGVSAAEASRLFEPFAQAQSGRARVGGTGLGLAISRQLARRMGGDVTLRSAEGEGSSFTLWLPAAPAVV